MTSLRCQPITIRALAAFSLSRLAVNPGLFQAVIHDDESAFAISRNNGSTWNQLHLSIPPSTGSTTWPQRPIAPPFIWLRSALMPASAATSSTRYGAQPSIPTSLPRLRPFHPSARSGSVSSAIRPSGSCNVTQSELPILRVVESCTDMKDGQLVGWAAQNASATNTSNSGGVMAWSPDYGDYWATITPRYPVQDFAFESSTTIYVLSADGLVQRLPYTGTSWSTNLPTMIPSSCTGTP